MHARHRRVALVASAVMLLGAGSAFCATQDAPDDCAGTGVAIGAADAGVDSTIIDG